MTMIVLTEDEVQCDCLVAGTMLGMEILAGVPGYEDVFSEERGVFCPILKYILRME